MVRKKNSRVNFVGGRLATIIKKWYGKLFSYIQFLLKVSYIVFTSEIIYKLTVEPIAS